MEEKILVYYIGVAGIRSEDIDEFVNKVTKRIISKTFKGEIIIIPVQSPNTYIDCINPKYITEPELIAKHKPMMDKLLNELHNQMEQLKVKNND